jgi:hypothetical protein
MAPTNPRPAPPPPQSRLPPPPSSPTSPPPCRGFSGKVTFVYNVTDSAAPGVTATATVTLTYPSPASPVAVDDSYTVEEGQDVLVVPPGLPSIINNDSPSPGGAAGAGHSRQLAGRATSSAAGQTPSALSASQGRRSDCPASLHSPRPSSPSQARSRSRASRSCPPRARWRSGRPTAASPTARPRASPAPRPSPTSSRTAPRRPRPAPSSPLRWTSCR